MNLSSDPQIENVYFFWVFEFAIRNTRNLILDFYLE